MIDKVFPRKLNSSKDARVRGKDEMIDAVNVTIDDNYDDFSSNSGIDAPSGNFGVLKPVKGNTAVPNEESVKFEANGRVIGSCVDERNQDIYYFVFSSNASEQGIYRYTKKDNAVKALLTSKYFKFDSNSFVESSVVYIPSDSSGSATVKPVIFFTDNINEPRKLDVLRASEGQSLSDSNNIGFLDFISTCPRTPIDPPVASFQNDPSLTVSNFKGKRGFQFAYQNIYKSGDVSALSTYSKLYVPRAYINQGAAPNASFFSENYLAVQIPPNSMSSEVDRVKLLVREGNTGSWFVVDEVEYDGSALQFDFYNDKVLTILPEAESRRQFDSVPKKAKAQEVTNNRLFFGNYVEGFDVPNIDAVINYESLERPQDFITFNLTLEPQVRNTNNPLGKIGTCNNRVASYRLGTSQLPDDGVPANTQIIFNISLSPDNHFHFYESRTGYHGSTRYNYLRDETNYFDEDVHAQATDQQVSPDFLNDGSQYFGKNSTFTLQDNGSGITRSRKSGVCFNPYGDGVLDGEAGAGFPRWRTLFAGDNQGAFDSAGQKATYGTNAGNPFIIQGKPMTFSGSFVTLSDLSKAQLTSAIKNMLKGPATRVDGVDPVAEDPTPPISIINSVSTTSYVIDLGLNNLDKINLYGSPDSRADLIVAVGKQDSLFTSENAQFNVPMGYFIVNKANPEFRLRDISAFYAIENPNPDPSVQDTGRPDDLFFSLDLIDLGDFQTLTCVPDVLLDYEGEGIESYIPDPTAGGNIAFQGWVCMSQDHIQFQVRNMTLSQFQSLFNNNAEELYAIAQEEWEYDEATWLLNSYQFADANLLGNAAYIAQTKGPIIAQNIRRWMGFLVPEGSTVTFTDDFNGVIQGAFAGGGVGDVLDEFINPDLQYLQFEGGRLINTFHNYAQDSLLNHNVNIFNRDDLYFDYAFSLLDGEAGAGGKKSDTASGQSMSSVAFQTIVMGCSPWSDLGGYGAGLELYRAAYNNMPLISNTSNISLSDFTDSPSGSGLADDDAFFEELHPHVEVFDFETVQIPPVAAGGEQTYKSFKTKANHDFGVVFYDERGRSSDVIPAGSIYIPGYNVLPEKGPIQVQVNLSNFSPPSWAWHYQLVYGGNSTVADFIQYTAGGAFVQYDSDDPDGNGNIYVSLNYLQNDSKVSYSNAFGAVNYDGNKDFYTYKEGDKLRILSYFGPVQPGQDELSARVFPESYEFDIVGTVTLADDAQNPLINPDVETPQACVGQFLILRNNPSAVGFTYNNVRDSIVDNTQNPSTSSHKWNNRCVFEIYSPRKNQDAEDRVYYEIGKKYRVIRDALGNTQWENPNIVLTEGDVYFRRLPVNMPRFDQQSSRYINLIQNGGGTNPRFLDYFLETQTFTDTIVGANQQNWGKPKIVNRFQREIRRDSSITFSDVNNYSLPRLRYCTFDATTSNFKDLPNSHGSIQKLLDRGDSVFVIQEDKISEIPVSRTLLSDAVGTDIVVASEKTLGTQRFYAGDFGCSDNPESVTRVGESIYFANKDKFEVYKFNPSNGVSVISEYGLKSYFRELFKSALDAVDGTNTVRVVGGYDPVLDEFVISVNNAIRIAYTSAGTFTQTTGTATPDPSIPSPPAVTVQDVNDLLDDVGDLAASLSEANQTINELQQQILLLYGQIGDVVNNPDEGGIDDVIADLNDQIDETTETIDSIENVTVSQIQAAESLHLLVLRQAQEGVAEGNAFITSYTGTAKADVFEGDLITLPANLNADVFSELGLFPGQEVNLEQYLSVVEAFVDKLREYNTNQTEPAFGRYDETQGTYVLRDQSTITFNIGYGIPTTDSLQDAFDDNVYPEGSALFDDAAFVDNFVGFNGYRADLTRLINSINANAIDDVLEENQNIKGELEESNATKLELLAQIAAFVDAIYEGRGPDPNTPPEDIDAQGKNPFGSDYGVGSEGGLEDSPLKNLYDAVQVDTNLSFSALEEQIIGGNNLLYNDVLNLIENGLLNYRNPYQGNIDALTATELALTATRDSLAYSLYNSVQTTYNVQSQLGGGITPTYLETSQTIPESFYNLIFAGSTPASADIIVDSLGGQTLEQDDLGSTFLNLFGNVNAVLDFLSGIQTTDTGTGEITDTLRAQIRGVLNDIKDEIDLGGFGTLSTSIDAISIDDILDQDNNSSVIESRIQSFRNLITDSTDTGGNLGALIENLQNLITPALTSVTSAGFYSGSQTNNLSLTQIGSQFDTLFGFPISTSPSYSIAQNILGNITEALTRLREFQALFGSEDLSSIISSSGTGFDINTSTPQSYGVGYTGDEGTGLTAEGVIVGQNIETASGNMVSSYDALRKALDKIINTTEVFAFFQDPNDFTVNGQTFNTIDGNPIIFQGTAQDILSPETYASLSAAIIAANGGGEDPSPTDPEQIVNLALSAANSSINTAIASTLANYDFAVRRSFASTANNPSGEVNYSFNISSGIVPSSDDLIKNQTSDLTGDGSVTTNDLLKFLSAFGQEFIPTVTIDDVADSTTAYVGDRPFANFSESNVGTFNYEFSEGTSTPQFITALTNALSSYIPANKVITFNPDTQLFELGLVN